MTHKELEILKLYQRYSKFKEYWLDEDLINWKLNLIPTSLEGKTVLDIGAFEGFYSLICEQRGAKQIVAIDNAVNYKEFCYQEVTKLIGTKVEPQLLDVQCLDFIKQKFDIVLLFDVLFSLKDIFGTIDKVEKKVTQQLIVCDKIANSDSDTPFFELINEEKLFWLSNSSGFHKMLEVSNFYPIKTLYNASRNRIGITALVSQKVTNIHSLEHRILYP